MWWSPASQGARGNIVRYWVCESFGTGMHDQSASLMLARTWARVPGTHSNDKATLAEQSYPDLFHTLSQYSLRAVGRLTASQPIRPLDPVPSAAIERCPTLIISTTKVRSQYFQYFR